MEVKDPILEEGSISSNAWDIILSDLEGTGAGIETKSPVPQVFQEEENYGPVPDISNIEVPTTLFEVFGEPKEKQPKVSKPQITTLLTEEEIQTLEKAKQIISKVLEMTTCGSIGVNMAGKTPKKPKTLSVIRKKKKTDKKKGTSILSKLDRYE